MKTRVILISLSILTASFSSYAERYKYENQNKGSKDNPPSIAANCNPATDAAELNINNTRALIQTGGDMWWDFNQARYEIPSGSEKTSLFAGSLWLAGKDISGQFKVAALRFRQIGNDYWTGPLSTVDAEITQQTCADYDRHWETTLSMVSEFNGWFEAGEFDRQNNTETQERDYPGYTIPSVITEWPAHGRNFEPYNEDYYLAPFYDRNGDGDYNPSDGDYPGYVLNGQSDCSRRVRDLYGDQNLWWVFNDKGNIHTESGGQAIGMEIRAQAFAYATTDEVNNMTFYNYELINRSTFELSDTYFGQWVDGDLGNAQDDYVGVDVRRGLGYFYNGDDNDEDASGNFGYGNNPPAIGVDFFQGPFQANDFKDNCLCEDYSSAKADDGIVYSGQGAGYGDGIPDNERYGMRKFLYHNNAAGATGDPSNATDYYNMLQGIWKDNTPMTFGGFGYDPTNSNAIPSNYMFPGDTDPLNWGTDGVAPPAGQVPWTEVSAGNPSGDRRFVQSSGPFKLGPGAVNNITVGVVWMQATSGGRLESVELMRRADDKTQALFDSCFEILDGPDAPDVATQELDREIILFLSNPVNSNNYEEKYATVDPFLAAPDSVDTDDDGFRDIALTNQEKELFSTYKFEGYQIYQLANSSVSTNDLADSDKTRLVAQVDIANDVDRLINYKFNSQLGQDVPQVMVDGANEGIKHSFRVTEDIFSTTDSRLINHKTYYFMVIAYAYNRYGDGVGNLQYIDGVYDPANGRFEGQKIPYLASRKSPNGAVRVIEAIPHKTDIEFDGVQLNAQYGDGIELTRIEGRGNGGLFASIKEDYLDSIASNESLERIVYEAGEGPVGLKVIDPLLVKPGEFTIQFVDTTSDGDFSNLAWLIYERNSTTPIDTIFADQTIRQNNEQLLMDLGLSLTVGPGYPALSDRSVNNGYVGFDIIYSDETNEWLTGLVDDDGSDAFNWIKSGNLYLTAEFGEVANNDATSQLQNPEENLSDEFEFWENIAGRTWAPFALASFDTAHPIPYFFANGQTWSNVSQRITRQAGLQNTPSVDIVITSDKSKWTRCPVLEAEDNGSLTQGNAVRGEIRRGLSVDKEGRNQLDPDCNVDEATFNGEQVLGELAASLRPSDTAYYGPLVRSGGLSLEDVSVGMGWFPGYAVNIETGEKLNMAFAENSWLGGDNGADMQWNPTSKVSEFLFGERRFGGMHMVYVFRNNAEDGAILDASVNPSYDSPEEYLMPAYDGGNFAFRKLLSFDATQASAILTPNNDKNKDYMSVMTAGAWVGYPLLAEGEQLFGTSGQNDVTIKLRSSQPYRPYSPSRVNVGLEEIVAGESYYVSAGRVTVLQNSINNQGDTFQTQVRLYNGDAFTAIQNGAISASGDLFLVKTINKGLPLYNFSTYDVAPTFSEKLGQDALEEIKAVPNPYYAYNEYETQRLEYLIKIINLPQTCTINIFTVDGTLVRTFRKDDPTTTSIDWDLKNQDDIVVASGLYIIHVEAPGIGEKVIKWFGVLRPIDLNSF